MPMQRTWTYWIWRIIGRLAFSRITVIGKELLPRAGPILFVATHRNGALDAAPYFLAAPDAIPMVSAQLHRIPLGRLLFSGISVSRAKDSARGIEADNTSAMRESIGVLKRGGQLFIMPEGTSTLGPRHLSFHRGAAGIARAAMEAGVVPVIVPLGVHYEDPTRWQSRVEVLVGTPIQPQSREESILHGLITQGLEEVGANFRDGDAQRQAEKLAYACTLGNASYALTLKSFEHSIPLELEQAVCGMERLADCEHLQLHQGVPLMPNRALALHALHWVALLMIVGAFIPLNAVALAAGYIAGKKLPDAPNVISFWRMAIGLPVGLAGAVLINTTLMLLQAPLLAALYWLITIYGIVAWRRFHELSVALYNGLFHADAKPALLHAYRNLLIWRRHERVA